MCAFLGRRTIRQEEAAKAFAAFHHGIKNPISGKNRVGRKRMKPVVPFEKGGETVPESVLPFYERR